MKYIIGEINDDTETESNLNIAIKETFTTTPDTIDNSLRNPMNENHFQSLINSYDRFAK